jgi:hypothetical protein
MAIFNSYVSLPEGISCYISIVDALNPDESQQIQHSTRLKFLHLVTNDCFQ